MNSDRLSEIARSLNRLQWQPASDERDFGNAFFEQLREAGKEQGAAFPRGTNWWNRLHTENIVMQARATVMVRDELLPAWRERLADSPMAELAELYVRASEPLLPHAERLLAHWHDAAPSAPTADEVAHEASRVGVSIEQAEIRLRFDRAAEWENETNPRGLWRELEPVWADLSAVRSTMAAAVTGDTEF